MSTTAAQHKGILVVHPDGAASWWSHRVPAVAAVTVTVGHGAAVQVDAAYPQQVLAWSVAAGGDVEALARALDDPELVARVQVLTADTDEVLPDDAPVLATAWQRRATVAAVDQCSVRPVSEGALLLDRAEAAVETGNSEAAEQLFALAAPTLMHLGEQCLDGILVGVVASDVARMAGVAAEALSAHGWGPDIQELARSLADELDATADHGIAAINDWVASVGVQTHLGEGAPGTLLATYVDPALVPQRMLAWTGADHPDLMVEIGSDETALVSVYLDAAADVRSPDSMRLLAYAAEPDGTVAAVAPMYVVGRALVATLSFAGRDEATLSFGVYHADVDPARLRTDPLAQVLVEVDRWMLDAFSRHRYARALLYASTAGDDHDAQKRQHTQLGIARTAAENAIELLESYVPSAATDHRAAALLVARRDAIRSYRESLTADQHYPDSLRPLLAEVVEPEPVEDGDA